MNTPKDWHTVDTAAGESCSADVLPGHIYFLTDGECIKVGYSIQPVSRKKLLQIGSSRELRLLATIPGTKAIEAALHGRLYHRKERGEWFRDSGYEIIHLIEQLVAAARPNAPMALLPYTEDIRQSRSELCRYMTHETLRIGTFESYQNALRYRLYIDLVDRNGGTQRERDYVRDRMKEIDDGSHTLMKGVKFKPWPPPAQSRPPLISLGFVSHRICRIRHSTALSVSAAE